MADKRRGKELTEISQSAVRSVVNGILGIAVIQSLLAGLGFLAMGISGAGVLALIRLVLAVVKIDILIPLSMVWLGERPTSGNA
jgi:predicted PurR-regulated permease PerM